MAYAYELLFICHFLQFKLKFKMNVLFWIEPSYQNKPRNECIQLILSYDFGL